MKFFKIFIRNFLKQKTTGILSIGGLSLGIAVTLLIGLWCLNEMNFDKFHHQPENIYRITRKGFINNETIQLGAVFAPLGKEIKKQFPEIEDMVRLFPIGGIVEINQRMVFEDGAYAVDSTFFNFFNYPMKYGSITNFISNPNAIIIDEQWANKYFPGENPVGQILSFQGDHEIAAVMYSTPINSHLKFHALLLMEGVSWINNNSEWGQNDAYRTYVRVNKNADLAALEKKITVCAVAHFDPYKTIEIHHILQPLLDIHFSNGFRFDDAITSDKKMVFTFFLMAVIILFIGCVNFVNLFISTSFLRAKSVGIKKTNGANKTSLIIEFYLETIFYVLTAIFAGILLAELFLPVFNSFIGYNLTINFKSPELYLFLGSLFLVTVLLAGTFPAFYMTRFDPVKTLKDQFKGQKVSVLQKGLIILQFAASIMLLIGVITIEKQISFLQNTNLGFNKENTLYIRTKGNIMDNYPRIRQELLASPGILEITAKNSTPIEWQQGNAVHIEGKKENQFLMEICRMKPNYFDMMEIPIINGQNPFYANDSLNYCLVNEQAAKLLNLKNPIGTKIALWDAAYTIKGVVKNTYTKSLHHGIDPQVYRNLPTLWSSCVMLIKTTPNPREAINAIKEMWTREVPNQPFEYDFLDDDYGNLYKAEKKAGEIVSWAMCIAFLITIAGLFGMARYATERRTKEIGVRKVNGAKVWEIIQLLNMNFIQWVAIAFIIASPLAWLVMTQWLSNFTIHTAISWWIFLLAGLFTLTITLLTVSYQTWKAATQNPVKSLKYE
ncbi:ABC transporter permease [Marinilabiliaceae bacterium JC017]|nr:ABC transporter permease [Marinilabiliaceae bacterium JC017]